VEAPPGARRQARREDRRRLREDRRRLGHVRAAWRSTLAKPSEAHKVELKSLAGTTDTVGFKVTYNPSSNATHESFRKLFEQNRVFEEVTEGLNKTIRLPTSVDVNTVDCNTINAFYDPNNKRIVVCYELVSYFLGMFKPTAKSDTELGNAVLGALIFSFFHETGHGLIDILQLPAVGREEDSVDQLATLILIASGDEGVQMALSGAYWFHLQSQGDHKTPFWDEHAFDGQRFYNILCLIYGSDPRKYAEFVSSGNLPRDRAQRCPDEYAKINKAWEKLLQPHLTNGAALNINYKPKVPVAEAPKKTNEDPWGNPAEPPATPAPPAEPPADEPKPAITCEQVAQKAGELIAEEAKQRAASMTEDEVEELKQKLDSELPAVIENILAECAKQNWSEASRKCVMKAKTLAQATKCQ
jgi:Putative metallopeptidase